MVRQRQCRAGSGRPGDVRDDRRVLPRARQLRRRHRVDADGARADQPRILHEVKLRPAVRPRKERFNGVCGRENP